MRGAHENEGGRIAVADYCLLLLCLAVTTLSARASVDTSPSVLSVKPYRVLLVVTEWADPFSVVVNATQDKFQPVAALLKAWSVPFDILTLNQQHLDATYLFDRSGNVRYGTVIWLSDSDSFRDQDLAALAQAADAGTSLIVINSRALDPVLNKLLGIKFREYYTSNQDFKVLDQHFVLRSISMKALPSENRDYSVRLWMAPTSAQVLIAQGEHPVVTVNQVGPGVSAIWLGASELPEVCDTPFWRNLLFNSLVWGMGYMVVSDVDYGNRIVLELDDWGTADKGFLSYWRYLEPDEQTIQHYLIEPLKQHQAIASAMVDTGYVDRRLARIVSPWTQTFTDMYGLHQDYSSTRKGLEDGLAAGVLNIESHGWSHMEPDLESAPGPWWTADLAGEASVDGWYSEFQDRLRAKDVPAVAQLYHMKRSLAELQKDFGVVAMELKPGGDAWSKSQFNNTAALAARVGFGIFHGDTSTYYLDPELVLDLASVVPDGDTGYDILDKLHPELWPYHPDGPLILGFHDRDISLDHNFMEQLFSALPVGYRTIATDEYVAILHTAITSTSDADGMQLTFEQDPHYCAYFTTHPSSWQLWFADPLRKQLSASPLELSIDDKPMKISLTDFSSGKLTINLPSGTGKHTWKLEAKREISRP